MQNYWIDIFSYIRYSILTLYYAYMGNEPLIRIAILFTIASAIVFLIFNILSFSVGITSHNYKKSLQNTVQKYTAKIGELVISPIKYDADTIRKQLGITPDFKLKRKNSRIIVDSIILMMKEYRRREDFNYDTYQKILAILRLEDFFNKELQNGNKAQKINALKTIAEISCHLKEAVASRYLFSRDRILRIFARIHQARFSNQSPFKELLDDPFSCFTQELMVKYHDALAYRQRNNMSMPNFLQWCTLPAYDINFRIFAISEIRLFKQANHCEELLKILTESSEESIMIEIVKTLGYFQYTEAKDYLSGLLGTESPKLDIAILKAFTEMQDDSEETVRILKESVSAETDSYSRIKILKMLYEYSDAGKRALEELEASGEFDDILFKHVKCKLI